jgi:hypothetical protein
MKKSTTFFEAKFEDHTGFLKNSFFESAIAAYSSGFGVVAMGVTEPVQFIADHEMKLLDGKTLRPAGLVAKLSQVAGKTVAQSR